MDDEEEAMVTHALVVPHDVALPTTDVGIR